MKEIAVILIPVVVVIIDAYTDKIDILNVKHLRGVILYMLGVAFPYSFFINDFPLHHLIIIAILTRVALFDPFLNWFTGNSFSTYNGDKYNQNRSLIDRFEDWTGISIFWLRVFYLIMYLGYLIYFIFNT